MGEQTPMVRRLHAEMALMSWALIHRHRDELVIAAVAAGISKNRVHVLTGIARTTIDRIIEENSHE